MASEKIKYSDLIEKEAIPRLISELKLVEEAMKDVSKSAKTIVTESVTEVTGNREAPADTSSETGDIVELRKLAGLGAK